MMSPRPQTVRAMLLEAFDIDARVPGIERPKEYASAMPAVAPEPQTESKIKQVKALVSIIRDVIDTEIRPGLAMSGKRDDDYGEIAECLRGRAPAPSGFGFEWTAGKRSRAFSITGTWLACHSHRLVRAGRGGSSSMPLLESETPATA